MKKLAIIGLLSLNAALLAAQGVSVSAAMDSTILLVGEQTKLTLEVAQSSGAAVAMPLIGDTLVSGLEVVERLPLDTQRVSDDALLVRQSYLLTAFDSALFFVDGLPFVCGGDTLYSAPMSLKVVSVPVDTAQHAIADIKPVYAPPFDWPLFWTIVIAVLGAAVVAVGGYFLYRYLQKRRQTATDGEEAEPQDLRPAHVIALERLDGIRNEKIWQQGRSKEYHTQLTDVVRDYIARRFGISAAEQTSAEILARIQPELKGQKDAMADLKSLLTVSDLVKFAKYKPLVNEDEKSLALAYRFVETTKMEEAAPSEMAGETPRGKVNSD